MLFVNPFKSHPRQWYRDGVELRTTVARRWTLRAQDPQIKSSQYVSGVIAHLDAFGAPATQASADGLRPHELLFFGSGGNVAEGAVSNVFLVKRKSLLTPSVASGILKGVTRSLVLGLARKRGWPAVETEITRHDLYTADECFLTNTSSEVLPVTRIDGRTIGGGRPGAWTKMLAEDFRGLR